MVNRANLQSAFHRADERMNPKGNFYELPPQQQKWKPPK
jgi:hypothetical protein